MWEGADCTPGNHTEWSAVWQVWPVGPLIGASPVSERGWAWLESYPPWKPSDPLWVLCRVGGGVSALPTRAHGGGLNETPYEEAPVPEHTLSSFLLIQKAVFIIPNHLLCFPNPRKSILASLYEAGIGESMWPQLPPPGVMILMLLLIQPPSEWVLWVHHLTPEANVLPFPVPHFSYLEKGTAHEIGTNLTPYCFTLTLCCIAFATKGMLPVA